MKSVQQLIKALDTASELVDAWDEAFETSDWRSVNILRSKLKQQLKEIKKQ